MTMPQKVWPSVADFQSFKRKLLRLGFRVMNATDRRSVHNLVPPRPRNGREVGFIFEANNLEVVVWTTWLEAENQIRESDEGWILIRKGRQALYFSRPLHRTKNFLLSLFLQARIAQLRVENRPHCPGCNSLMDIVRGRAMKQRYWRCDRVSHHPRHKPEWRAWDVCLSPLAKKYVDDLRQKRLRYHEQLIAQGKEPFVAMRKRKPWTTRQEKWSPKET